jgi:predicted small lipoprotein YifL
MRLGFSVVVLCLTGLGLAGCGQKGPLILPSDHAAKDSKAIYLIRPNKAQWRSAANPAN